MSNRMKGKPSFDEFRSGGAAQSAPAPVPTGGATPEPVHAVAALQTVLDSARESKTIRMRKSFSAKVRAQAFNRSNAEGRKVTESDVIDEALEQYFRRVEGIT